MTRLSAFTTVCLGVLALVACTNAYGAASYAQGSGNQIGIGEDPSGSPDVVNDITVTFAGGSYSFTDPGGVVAAGTGNCTEVSPNEVSCPGGGVFYLSAALAGGNDRLVLPLDTDFGSGFLNFGNGDDFFQGSDEPDQARGDAGNDQLLLGGGNDSGVLGGPGSDQIYGEAGDDAAEGDLGKGPGAATGAGDDLLDGGDGNDRLDGNYGADALIGGAGSDSLLDCLSQPQCAGPFGEPVPVIDNLAGGEGNDGITAGLGGDLMDGGPGDDNIGASGGTATGGEGNDILSVANGSYTVPGGQPQFLGDPAVLNGGPGDDILQGAAATFDFPAEQATDQLTCGDGSDRVVPGAGDIAGIDCEFVYELITCNSATCEGSVSVVAPQPPGQSKRANGGDKKLVLADKSFTVRRGQRAKLARMSKSAVKTLLKNRRTAGVTKTLELTSGGGNSRKTKRTKTRYKLSK